MTEKSEAEALTTPLLLEAHATAEKLAGPPPAEPQPRPVEGDSNPIVCAYLFDPSGFATVLNPRAALDALCSPGATDGSWAWFHLKRGHPSLQSCLSEDALYELKTEEEAQPRCVSLPGRSVLLRLRGLRRRTTAPADGLEGTALRSHENDLFSFSLLLRPDKALSCTDASLDAIRMLRKQLTDCIRAREPAFASPGAFTAQLVEYVVGGAMELVHRLQEELDELEECVEDATATARSLRHGRAAQRTQDETVQQLGTHRRTAVKLRRWIWPQRAVVKELAVKGSAWLFAQADEEAKQQQAQNVESTIYLLEALENIREHSAVLKDELAGLYQMRTGHALYILSMVSALFLPFTFVTGLLSMYITYPDYISQPKEDFYVITITCLALLAGSFILFRRLRWI